MLQSMTGYTSTSFSFLNSKNETLIFEVSLKSLNSRFFEAHVKIPAPLYPIEHKIVKTLKKNLKRGSIYLFINCLDPEKLKSDVNVCFSTLSSYISSLNVIKEKFNLNDEIKIADIIRLPNIFSSSDVNLNQEQEDKIISVINDASNKLIAERLKEGQELQIDLLNKIVAIKKDLDLVSELFVQHFQEKQDAINEQLNNIVKDAEEAELRRNYLYAMLDKMDLNEEIVRFKTHLKKLEETILSKELEKGKSLDFTLQELGREINTILSKTHSSMISTISLNIKVEIEKSREQVQNII